MGRMAEPDFDRTWLYRATVNGRTVAEDEHGSDIAACQWAVQVVWPGLLPKPSEGPMLIEREDGSGDWRMVEKIWRARQA